MTDEWPMRRWAVILPSTDDILHWAYTEEDAVDDARERCRCGGENLLVARVTKAIERRAVPVGVRDLMQES